MHADKNGLYLQVSAASTKRWIYRYSLHGRRREMGLGALATVPERKARAELLGLKQKRPGGRGPDRARRRRNEEGAAAVARAAGRLTFRTVAEQHIDNHESRWRNAKHAQQWRNSLSIYAYPVIGDVAVDEVDEEVGLAVLTPIWKGRLRPPRRVRSRIEVVLDAGAARKLRSPLNPTPAGRGTSSASSMRRTRSRRSCTTRRCRTLRRRSSLRSSGPTPASRRSASSCACSRPWQRRSARRRVGRVRSREGPLDRSGLAHEDGSRASHPSEQ